MVCWRDDHARKIGGEYRLAARDPLDSFCRNLKRRHLRKIDNSTRRIRFRQNICDQSQALGEQILGNVPLQTPANGSVYRVEFKARSHFNDLSPAATRIQHNKSTATLSDLIAEISPRMRRVWCEPAISAEAGQGRYDFRDVAAASGATCLRSSARNSLGRMKTAKWPASGMAMNSLRGAAMDSR